MRRSRRRSNRQPCLACPRHGRLHGARAGARRSRRSAIRSVCVRLCSVRDGVGPPRLPARDRRRNADRDAARRAAGADGSGRGRRSARARPRHPALSREEPGRAVPERKRHRLRARRALGRDDVDERDGRGRRASAGPELVERVAPGSGDCRGRRRARRRRRGVLRRPDHGAGPAAPDLHASPLPSAGRVPRAVRARRQDRRLQRGADRQHRGAVHGQPGISRLEELRAARCPAALGVVEKRARGS